MSARDDALAAAMAEPDPSSLAAAARLRRSFDADDAAWALAQAALRRSAAGRFARADEMLFTRAGLEQATREPVARWRAARFVAAGVTQVWELGCGIGLDSMAFAEAGLRVVAVEADGETAAVAAHNLALVDGDAEVRVGFAEEAAVPPGAAVFLDPARRTAEGRTWNVADFTPPWDFVLGHLASERFVAVKLGPGLPKELIPASVLAGWTSHRGDVVEATLWNRLGTGTEAVVLPHELRVTSPPALEVRPLGRYLLEPDGAVIRAGLVSAVAPGSDVWLLDRHTAYLSADEPVDTVYATTFEVDEVLPYDVKVLRRWVADRGVGTLEIKKRAIDVDPAELRRKLRPKGPGAATLILARTLAGTVAIAARRVGR